MEFRLLYVGKLGSNKNAKTKMEIRKQIHPQLKKLWNSEPFKSFLWSDPGRIDYFKESVCGFEFITLITEKLSLFCELDILFLRFGQPGSLYVGGDIDNRIKTLFDALSLPKANQLNDSITFDDDEKPLYCLLKDDALITKVNIETDQLYVEEDPKMVRLIIKVKVRTTSQTWLSHGLGIPS